MKTFTDILLGEADLAKADIQDNFMLLIAKGDLEKYVKLLEADNVRFKDGEETSEGSAVVYFENKRAWKQGLAIQAKNDIDWDYSGDMLKNKSE